MSGEATHLAVTLRFLDAEYHGRRDGHLPEWPPSPLRVIQALVAAANDRTRSMGSLGDAAPALRWLETLPPPIVIAPQATPGMTYRSAVPNNDLDVVASAWSRGLEPKKQPSELKTMKSIRLMRLRDGNAVHYLWPLSGKGDGHEGDHISALERTAHSVVVLGWGIDLVVGDARPVSDAEIAGMAGDRWIPGPDASMLEGLRVPVPGTVDALIGRERAFLARLDADGFYRSPPPLSVFGVRSYRTARSVAPRQIAAFSILRMDAAGFRTFDPARRGLTVAGMVRHAARMAAENTGWSKQQVDALVLGHSHGDKSGRGHVPVGAQRFAYLPLPSVEWRGDGEAAGAIRRVLVTSFSDELSAQIDWLRRSLSGQALVDERSGEPIALLSLIPSDDRVVRRCVAPASTWTTLTPVVLPGFDDPARYRRRISRGVSANEQRELLARLEQKTDELLRKAIIHAGYSEELAKDVELEWRSGGFIAGVDQAGRYGVPDHLARFPRLHVRLRWRNAVGEDLKVGGPICLGGGRYYGLGLLCALE